MQYARDTKIDKLGTSKRLASDEMKIWELPYPRKDVAK
jgi:hypothetical protein